MKTELKLQIYCCTFCKKEKKIRGGKKMQKEKELYYCGSTKKDNVRCLRCEIAICDYRKIFRRALEAVLMRKLNLRRITG